LCLGLCRAIIKFMQELRYAPVAFWRLDDNTPFTDFSGYSRTGTRAGTETQGVPVTATASYGQLFDTTRIGTFTVPSLGLEGSERHSYSISFSIQADAIGLDLYNEDEGFGFIVRNNYVEFYLSFTGESVVLTHEPTTAEKFNVVATYGERSASLYVNGVLADFADILQPDLTFVAVGDDFLVGGTGKGIVNNLAFFNTELSAEQVAAIHNSNNRVANESPPTAYAGQVVPVAEDNRKPWWEFICNTEDHWNSGTHQLTTVDNGRLEAQKDEDGLSIASSWEGVVSFVSPEAVPLNNSSYFWWEGVNVTVEYSIDGVAWDLAVPGQEVTSPAGENVTDSILYLRVVFPAGEEDTFLDWLTYTVFTGTTAQMTPDTRVVSYNAPATTYRVYQPHLMRQDWGVRINTSGSLDIAPQTGGETVKTLEFWVKPDTTYNTNRTGTTTYVNGVSGGTIIPGVWNIVHITSTTGWTTATTFGAGQQIGQVVYYEAVLTQEQITNIIASYTGFVRTTVSGSVSLVIEEPTTPATIYTHDWARFSPMG